MPRLTTWSRGTVRDTFDRWCTVNPETGCHEWTRSLSSGYGQLNVGGRSMLAHRFAWLRHYGAIPNGQHVLHRCDNRRCVNIEHLFLGTNLDNIRDKSAKGRGKGPSLHGESHPLSKLTWEAVQEIRRRYSLGGISQLRLGREFRVSQTCIGSIVRGKGWIFPRKAYVAVEPKRVTVAKAFDQYWREDTTTGCWLWTLALSDSGHGKVSFNGKKVGAHKFSYQRSVGPVPDGMVVRHICDCPSCVNPSHLCLGVQSENVRDMVLRNRQRGAVGERNSHAKLNTGQILDIRRRAASGQRTIDLAYAFRVSSSQIRNIIRGDSWSGPTCR